MAGKMSSLIDLQSQDHLQELLEKKRLLVLHFWTSWSEPCTHINETLNDLCKEISQCFFVKVEAESLAEVSLKYEVVAVPTIVFVKDGHIVDRVNGAHMPEIARKARALSEGINTSTHQSSTEYLDTRLKMLVNTAPCMLFMKGNPQEPQCGFSRQAVSVLQECNAEFSSFDILQDDEVRASLKKYSNWPTYPQLYVNGELIGGLDIMKELKMSGELESMLPKKITLQERLQSLICKSPIVLFMKGSPELPKCGFSHSMCDILKEAGVDYSTFDILQDDEVRQGLKKYSNWPTYPQLYVNGELVGGLDIIKELKESGDLMSMLKPQ